VCYGEYWPMYNVTSSNWIVGMSFVGKFKCNSTDFSSIFQKKGNPSSNPDYNKKSNFTIQFSTIKWN